MSKQKIRVSFDPAACHEDRFSFTPERVVLNGDKSAVVVKLRTKGPRKAKARFSETGPIQWITEGPQGLETSLDPDRRVLTLRGFPRNETQENIDYGYAVTVEFQGRTFSSSIAQYPELSCVQTGGG